MSYFLIGQFMGSRCSSANPNCRISQKFLWPRMNYIVVHGLDGKRQLNRKSTFSSGQSFPLRLFHRIKRLPGVQRKPFSKQPFPEDIVQVFLHSVTSSYSWSGCSWICLVIFLIKTKVFIHRYPRDRCLTPLLYSDPSVRACWSTTNEMPPLNPCWGYA